MPGSGSSAHPDSSGFRHPLCSLPSIQLSPCITSTECARRLIHNNIFLSRGLPDFAMARPIILNTQTLPDCRLFALLWLCGCGIAAQTSQNLQSNHELVYSMSRFLRLGGKQAVVRALCRLDHSKLSSNYGEALAHYLKVVFSSAVKVSSSKPFE